MAYRRTAQELAEQIESNELHARQAALTLAHDLNLSPRDVVMRAEAYRKFILGEDSGQ